VRESSPEELMEVFDAFDATVTYDQPSRRLELAATVTPELLQDAKPPTAIQDSRGVGS
jgi:hypothetical protein